MPSLAPAKNDRNDFIINAAVTMDAHTISQELWRKFKLDVSTSAVNSIIHRAKQNRDPRIMGRRDRRGSRGSSPFKLALVGSALRRKEKGSQPGQQIADDTAENDLPPTARLLFNGHTMTNLCKYPLAGSGVSLIVCGQVVAPDSKSSYCPACREKTVLRK